MSTKAHIKDEWTRGGIGLAVMREQGPTRELILWGEPAIHRYGPSDEVAEPVDGAFLFLREDDARAIYEALADHFGHAGHDARALRRDYDAERKRVDLLLGNTIGRSA